MAQPTTHTYSAQFQYTTGYLAGISKSTVSSIVMEVADAIVKKSRQFI